MPGTPSTRTTPLSPPVVIPVTEAAAIAAFARRDHAGLALADDVERVASAARAMATRFRLGGKLIVFGGAGTDAAHVASDDPAVVKEVHVTACHLLWEPVHVLIDRPGPAGREADR